MVFKLKDLQKFDEKNKYNIYDALLLEMIKTLKQTDRSQDVKVKNTIRFLEKIRSLSSSISCLSEPFMRQRIRLYHNDMFERSIIKKGTANLNLFYREIDEQLTSDIFIMVAGAAVFAAQALFTVLVALSSSKGLMFTLAFTSVQPLLVVAVIFGVISSVLLLRAFPAIFQKLRHSEKTIQSCEQGLDLDILEEARNAVIEMSAEDLPANELLDGVVMRFQPIGTMHLI